MIQKILCSFDLKISIIFGNYNTGEEKFFSSDVVYKVLCSDCPSVYVRKICQLLKTRTSLHENDVKKEAHRTALSSYAFQTGPTFSFEETSINCKLGTTYILPYIIIVNVSINK